MIRQLAIGLVTVFAVLLNAGTSLADSTLIVQVRTDLAPRTDFVGIQLRGELTDGCGTHLRNHIKRVNSSQNWAQGVRVAEINGLKKGTIRFTVSAINSADQVVVKRPVRVDLRKDGIRVVTVLLTGGGCSHKWTSAKHACTQKRNKCNKGPGKGKGTACGTMFNLCVSKAAAARKQCERPKPRSGPHSRLLLVFKTGGDDLRGGRDNVDVVVRFKGGGSAVVRKANKGRRWRKGCTTYVPLNLLRSVPFSKLSSVTLTTSFRGGMGGDNWNLDHLIVQNASGTRTLRSFTGRPLKRFTGSQKRHTLRF